MLKIDFSILISNYAGTPTNKLGSPLNNNNNNSNSNNSNNNQNNDFDLPCGASGCMMGGIGTGTGVGVGIGAITASPSGRRKRQQELQVSLVTLISTRVIFECTSSNLTLFPPSHCMTTNSKLSLNSNNSNNSENNFPLLLPCEPLPHLQLAGL